ncbi:MAG: hypothetical protein V1684_00580, partial [bacterium]
QEIKFKDKDNNDQSLIIDKLESNQITFTYQGNSYALNIGESQEINGYTFTITEFGEIIVSQGAYQPPKGQERPGWLSHRPAPGESKQVNPLGEQLSWGTVNRALENALGKEKAEQVSYQTRLNLALLTTYGYDDQPANWRFYAGVIQAYITNYGRAPETEADYLDLYNIAHGRKPQNRQLTREIWAIGQFGRVYWRLPKFSKPTDDWAIWMMAYDIRPATPNLKSEIFALGVFRSIYKRLPKDGQDWSIVRAIANSGAGR